MNDVQRNTFEIPLRRRAMLGLIPLTALLFCAPGVTTFAAEATADSAGLRGILPEEIPDAVETAVAALKDNWKGWSDETLKELEQLYSNSPLDVAGQRKLLSQLRSRVKTVQKSLEDDAYASIRDQLLAVHGTLGRRVALATAILDTLEQSPAAVKAALLNSARTELVQATTEAETWLTSLKNHEGWVKYLQIAELKSLVNPSVESNTKILTVSHQTLVPKWDARLATTTETQKFLKNAQIVRLEKAVNSYSDAVAIANLVSDPAALRKELANLVKNLEGYESEGLKSFAKGVRESWKGVRLAAADGGARIDEALRANFFSYNMEVATTESFALRLISEKRQEEGEVRDCILGADVFGNQVTCTDSAIDFLPSNGGFLFNINLNGAVNSSTDGYTNQAVIHTEGNHTFCASKEVRFNGKTFTTAAGAINVSAHNNPTSATVKGGNIPFFGAIKEDIALGTARSKTPQTEAIAASRVEERVLPRFDSEVDSKFQKATTDWEAKIVKPLKDLKLYPEVVDYQTTDDYALIATRLMEAGELGGYVPHRSMIPRDGMSILVHESLINNALDRLELAGKTMTGEEVQKLIEEKISQLLGRKVKAETVPAPAGDDDAPKAMIFAASDPIRARVRDGRLTLIFRAGFKRGGGKEDIGQQTVTVPFKFELKGDDLVVGHDPISSTGGGLSRAISRKFESSLNLKPIKRTTSFKKVNDQEEKMTLKSVRAIDSWLCITFE